MHSASKDDRKSKPQIFKFYNFVKGDTEIIDQFGDYYSPREKSLRWVMMALYYMLDMTRVNVKTVWSLKEGLNVHRLNSHDFSWNLAKSLAISHAARRNLNILSAMAQMKRKLLLGTALVEPKWKPKIENRYKWKGKELRCKIHYEICTTKDEKDKFPQSKEQCQSCSDSICLDHPLSLCKKMPTVVAVEIFEHYSVFTWLSLLFENHYSLSL